MRWPFRAWGVSLVVSGHQHVYERIERDGMTYVLNGLGGHPWLYDIHECKPVRGSRSRFNTAHGAMLMFVNRSTLSGAFYEHTGRVVDSFHIPANTVSI